MFMRNKILKILRALLSEIGKWTLNIGGRMQKAGM